MPTFDKLIDGNATSEGMVPTRFVPDVIKTATKESSLMSFAKHATLSTAKQKQPVLATLPDAYWVDGITGLKQTTAATWEDVLITAEELAVIVPIPDALVADSSIPLWDEIQPLLAEAIGRKIDQAALFGVDKPDSWPEALVPGATAAGNVLKAGTGADLGVDVATLAEKVSAQGFPVNGFISRPGLNWKLVQMRDAQGQPIYSSQMTDGQPRSLYGYGLREVHNGAWDATKAEMIMADWSKVVVGVRQDMTYKLFSEGVISDAAGKVVMNLMQQDAKALRVVMRVGYTVANPVTALESRKNKRFPAGVLQPPAPKG